MNRQRIAFAVVLTYLWVMMILLGAIMLVTFMVYPNIFYDAPRSLETAMELMAVRAPNDYFPPLGFLSWVVLSGARLSIDSLVYHWPFRPSRGDGEDLTGHLRPLPRTPGRDPVAVKLQETHEYRRRSSRVEREPCPV